MKRKMILAPLIILLMLLAVAPAMATQPKVWTEKNNEKFETFVVLGRASLSTPSMTGDWQYIPSEENPNKIVVSWNEVMTLHQITIDGVHVYTKDTDFAYTGRQTVTLYDPVIPPTPIVTVYSLIATARMVHIETDYTYDFSAVPGGIEGTLRMQANYAGDGSPIAFSISSLSGTGDLQNVQIKATSMSQSGTYNFAHNGIVIGWPV